MSLPLTARILTQSSVTMLIQVLTGDSEALVTGLESVPLPPDDAGNERERLRIVWQRGTEQGAYTLLLYGLPAQTWSEQLNPAIPTPAPILFLESDLPQVFTMLTEGFVAGGGRRGERPAWLLREDWTAIPTLAESAGAERERALETVLQRSAEFHAFHWGAEQVLDEVYPWLPRFAAWSERDSSAPRLASAGGMPQTIIHGTWRAENLRLRGDELLVEGWDRVMVGPAAWDIYCLLDSLGILEWESWVRRYCGYLKAIVAEFVGEEAMVEVVRGLRNT